MAKRTLIATPPAPVLRSTMAQVPGIHLWLRADGSVAYANAEGSAWLLQHAGAGTILTLFAGMKANRWSALYRTVRNADNSRMLTVRALATGRHYEAVFTPVATRHECLHLHLTDISRRKSDIDQLKASHGFYQAIINAIGDAVFVKDRDLRRVLFNDEYCRSMGYSREFLLGKTDADLFGAEEAKTFQEVDQEVFASGEVQLNTEEYTSGAGEKIVVTTKRSRYVDPAGNPFVVGVSRDVTVQKRVERKLQRTLERLAEQSLTDDLTRLYNRRGFVSLAEQQLKLADRHGFVLCLIFADLNNLKGINDRFGHTEGDEAIKAAARVITQSFRKSDLVGRLGGDEFIILAAAANEDDGPILKEHLHRDLVEYNKTSGKPYELSLSIGVTTYLPGGGTDIFELMQTADQAMYAEKVRFKAGAR